MTIDNLTKILSAFWAQASGISPLPSPLVGHGYIKKSARDTDKTKVIKRKNKRKFRSSTFEA